jgi:hypothetical protein
MTDRNKNIKYVTLTPSKKNNKKTVNEVSEINLEEDTSDTDNVDNKYSNINKNYERPELTATDLMNPNDIKKRLINHELIRNEELEHITSNTRIQYFEVTKDAIRYKSGGFLIINKYPTYFILANGKTSWSVQLKNNIFYREISLNRVKEEYENKIKKQNMVINELRFKISSMEKIIKKMSKNNN